MNNKRAYTNNVHSSKRLKINNQSGSSSSVQLPSDTNGTLYYLSSLFPVEKFQKKLPPIVMKHQIYALVECRTEVDKNLNDLLRRGDIRLFKLDERENSIAVVYFKDYKEHLMRICENNKVVENFLKVVSQCPDISYSGKALNNHGVKDSDINELRQQGILICRDVRCYWLAIPGVSAFTKTLAYGRNKTVQYIKRTKYRQMLKSELEQRKLPRQSLLGMLYHIYDLIGTDYVTCIETPIGCMLQLEPGLVNR